MQNALYIEISTIGLCLLLTILYNQRQNIGSSTTQRQFNLLIYATMAALIIDTATWVVDGATFPHARTLNIITETLYYFFDFFIPFLWVIYVELTIGKEQKQTLRRLHLLAIPMLAMTLVLLVNLKAGFIFYVDENNIYHRSAGLIAVVALVYIYLTYASLRALGAARRAGWNEDKRRYYLMAFFMVLPAVGGLIQTFCYGVTLIWIFVAISIMLLYIDSLNRQVSTDPLTGINNRRELNKYLLRQIKEPADGCILALIMMDVDGFKEVNDTYGHFYGDKVLAIVADILKQSCKGTSAFLARFGGDEFCIVYRTEDIEAVKGLIAGIQANATRWNAKCTHPVAIGLSIGYAVRRPMADETIETLYQRADKEMYQAKERKRKEASY